MAELPVTVRRRLSQVAAGGDHPDAGLLTAFVEGTLARTHRDDLLEHLVACSECNRLVALIAPEPDSSRVMSTRLRRRWFAWAPARWASAAAALAVVISAVWVGHVAQQTRLTSTPSAAVEKASTPTITAQLPVPTAQPRALQRAPRLPRPVDSAALSRRAELPQASPVVAAQSRPAAPENFSDSAAFQTSMFSAPGSWLELSASSVEPQPLKNEAGPLTTPNLPGAAVPQGPTWLVSAGVLRKSNDGGHTWTPAAVPASVPLNALSTLGNEIWTGGDRGALYHSSDGGQTWTAVVPASNGVELSADITRITFADTRQGWIATRDGNIWMTGDGGATWSQK